MCRSRLASPYLKSGAGEKGKMKWSVRREGQGELTSTGVQKEERGGEERLDRRLDRDNAVGSWLHVRECQGNGHRMIRIKELGQEGR